MFDNHQFQEELSLQNHQDVSNHGVNKKIENKYYSEKNNHTTARPVTSPSEHPTNSHSQTFFSDNQLWADVQFGPFVE